MQNTNRQDGDSLDRYGSGVLPDGAPVHLKRSPVINYTYARTRPILERLKKAGDIDKRHGARVRYVQSDHRRLGAADHGRAPRAVAEGLQGRGLPLDRRHHLRLRRGSRHDQDRRQTFEWGPNDVFVVPPWKRYATLRRRSRCCSRSPTAPLRKRSASGARATDLAAELAPDCEWLMKRCRSAEARAQFAEVRG